MHDLWKSAACGSQAVNEIGESLWSKAVSFTTQASVPDQPAPPTAASATADSVTMQWQPPRDNGEPISQYRLERDDGRSGDFELAYTGPDCEALVGGLQSGVPYRFRLWAFNSVRTLLFAALRTSTLTSPYLAMS